jgi:hypothetical protein
MQTTKVVHKNKEPYDILIDRSTIFGNPYEIGVDGTRSEVIAKFKKYFDSNVELQIESEKLRGKALGCWCKPKACHGDVIVDFLETPKLW